MSNPSRPGVYATRQRVSPSEARVVPPKGMWYYQYFTGSAWSGYTSGAPHYVPEKRGSHNEVVEWRPLTKKEAKSLPPQAHGEQPRPKRLLLAGLAAATLAGCGGDVFEPGDWEAAKTACATQGGVRWIETSQRGHPSEFDHRPAWHLRVGCNNGNGAWVFRP